MFHPFRAKGRNGDTPDGKLVGQVGPTGRFAPPSAADPQVIAARVQQMDEVEILDD